MPAESYKILKVGDGHEIITGENSHLKLHVYKLRGHSFRANPEELQFYGDTHSNILAFETEAWCDQQLEYFTAAITWYKAYIGHRDMEISIDPKKFLLKLVK
jgi:hypothetical protein